MIRIAKKTKCPPHWMYYKSNTHISPLTRTSALKGLTFGLLMMAELAGPLVCVKDIGKIRNQWVEKCLNWFIPWQLSHGSRYCSINNTNKFHILVSSGLLIKTNRQDNKLPDILMNLKFQSHNYCDYKWCISCCVCTKACKQVMKAFGRKHWPLI